ncbi:MAG: AAA family ATPase [Thermoleophilia bacterium]|nr:AAA family ATPase [Thermoleophilia bacterium]
MPLVGRDTELDRLRTAIGGGGGGLLIPGAPGIGKSALLDAAIADPPGTVLSARGRETETHLAFAVLGAVLEPLRERIGELHPARGGALAAALALAPPAPGDRFAVFAAATDLIALADADAPVAVVVDDLHWADPESAECLAFLARRCPPGAAVILATRPSDGDAPWRDLPALALEPLPEEAARALLMRTAPDLPDAVAAQLLGAAAGNALALTELPGMLAPDERAGLRPIPRPLTPGPGLGETFGRRVAALPEESRLALLVAALGGPDMGVVTRACEALGTSPRALVPAEAAGLISLAAGLVTFRHPLVRGAANDGAPAEDRRRAHAALGAVGGPQGAWHLAEAALGPDEGAAAALEASAADAQARGGHATAADALERAARLTPHRETGLRRLAGAGAAAFAAGLPMRADALLAEAAGADDPLVRATAQHVGGLSALWGGMASGVAQRIAPAAEALAGLGAPHAPQVLADAATAALAAGDCRMVVALAERGYAMLGPDADAEARAHLLAILGLGLVLRGERRRALPLLEEVDRLLPGVERLSPAGLTISWAMNSRLPTEEYARAREETLELAERARQVGALSAVPMVLAFAADAERRMGERAASRVHAEEAWALAHELRQFGPANQAGIVLLQLAAEEGRVDEARVGIGQLLTFSEAAGAGSSLFWGRAILGSLELGLGDAAAAVEALAPLPALADRLGLMEPTICAQDPDLVEALWRCDRQVEARAAARRLCEQAARSGGSLALALAARCRGLLAGAGHDAHFAEALAHHERSPDSFHRARTLLAYGLRLRRDGRRAQAREHLRAAQDLFARLGAAPWEAQAASELRLSGGRRRASRDPDALSIQERRVAELVAGGATNREIAAALVVSHRTVEHHVASIYRKVGVSRRAELARVVADGRLEPAPH